MEETELRSALTVFVTLLFVSMLMAQDEPRPESKPSIDAAISPAETPAPAASIKPRRVIDKRFVFIMGSLGAAESLRFTTRKLVIEHEYAAGAPWITRVPANPPMVAKDLGLYASELLVAYEMKKPHDWLPGDRVIRKLWWVYPVAMTALHIKNGVGNIRTQGPGGCASIDCAMSPP